jgi:hypothetical protein
MRSGCGSGGSPFEWSSQPAVRCPQNLQRRKIRPGSARIAYSWLKQSRRRKTVHIGGPKGSRLWSAPPACNRFRAGARSFPAVPGSGVHGRTCRTEQSPIREAMQRPDTPQTTRTIVDRRRTPDRRQTWRGGRRDSDWITRPAGALALIERAAAPALSVWRRLFSSAPDPPASDRSRP